MCQALGSVQATETGRIETVLAPQELTGHQGGVYVSATLQFRGTPVYTEKARAVTGAPSHEGTMQGRWSSRERTTGWDWRGWSWVIKDGSKLPGSDTACARAHSWDTGCLSGEDRLFRRPRYEKL